MDSVLSSPNGSVHAVKLENPFVRRPGPRPGCGGPTRPNPNNKGSRASSHHHQHLAQLDAHRRRAKKAASRRLRERDARREKKKMLNKYCLHFASILSARTATWVKLRGEGRRIEARRHIRRSAVLVVVIAAVVAAIEAGELESTQSREEQRLVLDRVLGDSTGCDEVSFDGVRRLLSFD